MKYASLISKMTLEEKARLCSGKNFWHLQDIERLGIPSIMVTDGPHGIRKQASDKEGVGLKNSVPSVCYPTAATTACSWDRELLKKMGAALGEECVAEQVAVLLGPGANIKRSPLCGRNFEYFSEDPYLTGEMAASLIEGVQLRGVGTSLKHFAVNNQETRRMTVDTIVDERALREIYLAGFEHAVCKAKPWTVMSAYNKLNGTYCSENKWLLKNVLRNEWGFNGVVVTDWGAENDIVEAIKVGNNLEMPSSGGFGPQKIINAVRNGELDENVLNESISRILTLISRGYSSTWRNDNKYDKEQHHFLARKIARESFVLLKNEDNILPIDKTKKVAVIGEMARHSRYQGDGSSLINPYRLDNAYEALLLAGVTLGYAAGYDKKTDVPDEALIAQARALARKSDIVLLFAGLTERYETEGLDRRHMRLPANHNALIDAVCAVNKNVVVILSGGSSVEMPWIHNVKAVVNGYLGGQAVGSAIADIVLGKVNPCGKLAETYPLALEDNPSYSYFPGKGNMVEYRESIFVGYRYYDTAEKEVLFPFGFGLSYTQFEYSDIKLSKENIKESEELKLSFKIKNIGDVDGAEIAQVYVSDIESTIFKAQKELKGFEKIFLLAGEEKEVTVSLDRRAFAYYNVNIGAWHVESGKYKISVGASSRDIRLSAEVDVISEQENVIVPDYRESAPSYYKADIKDVPGKEFYSVLGYECAFEGVTVTERFTLNSTLKDAMDTKSGQRFYSLLIKILKLSKVDFNNSMMFSTIMNTPIRCFVSMSQGVFSEDMAYGLLRIFKGQNAAKGMLEIATGLAKSITKIAPLIKSI